MCEDKTPPAGKEKEKVENMKICHWRGPIILKFSPK